MSAPPGRYGYRRISPDGRRIAYDRRLPGGGPTRDVYIWDLERGTEIRLTNDPGEEFFADWSPDGDWIYYSSNQDGIWLNVYRRAANGAGGEELIFASGANLFVNDVMPDGQGITVAQPSEGGRLDLYMLSLREPIRLDPLVVTPAHEYNGFVSPEGRHYVYQTDRDGQFEVWVSPLGESDDAPVKVSIDGGIDPGWSLTGDEVFYRSREGSMMAAPIVTTPRLDVGEVVELFENAQGIPFGATGGRGWDVSPLDGRFLFAHRPPATPAGIRVILYWGQELRSLTEP